MVQRVGNECKVRSTSNGCPVWRPISGVGLSIGDPLEAAGRIHVHSVRFPQKTTYCPHSKQTEQNWRGIDDDDRHFLGGDSADAVLQRNGMHIWTFESQELLHAAHVSVSMPHMFP